MKKFIYYFNLLFLAMIFAGSKIANAQCGVVFGSTYDLGNGYVQFYGASASGNSTLTPGTFSWSFGNGNSVTSTSISPATINSYTANGIYTVTLTYTDAANSCTSMASQTITVSNYGVCSPTVSILSFPTNNTGEYAFSEVAEGGSANPLTTYTWDYGDGSPTGSNSTNTHSYTNGGTYTVTVFIDYNIIPTCTTSATYTLNVCNFNPTITYTYNANGAVDFNFSSATAGPNTVFYWDLDWNDPNYSNWFNSGALGANPSFTYNTNGVHTVSVNVFNAPPLSCTGIYTLSLNISNVINPCGLNAGFYMGANNGNGQLGFVNYSTGTVVGTTYSWDFGDGSPGSTQNSPVHTYTAIGTYTATLIANNNYSYTCASTFTQSFYISSVPSCSLNANFYAQPGASGNCSFVSTVSGTNANTTYSWNYGDNSGSTNFNAPHTYSANGTYTVSLTVSNNATCTVTQSITVVINNICNLSSAFTASLGSNGIVYFTDNSTGTNGTTSYYWDFGDGSNSTSPSPNHNYTNGTYFVSLYVLNQSPSCSSNTTQTITVTTGSCFANTTFTAYPSGTPQLWYAAVVFSANVVAATWYWGDGSSTNGLYPSHTYSAAGNYSICLSTTVACGASNTYCMPYNIFRPAETNENDGMIQINVLDPATVGIEKTNPDKSMFTISPNPNNGNFQLILSGLTGDRAIITVYNAVGEKVYSDEAPTFNGNLIKDLKFNDTSNGIYFININDKQQSLTQKIIISGN